MKLNLFVTALISAAFTHGVSAFYLAEEEYDALSQIDVLTDLNADLDADIYADLDADAEFEFSDLFIGHNAKNIARGLYRHYTRPFRTKPKKLTDAERTEYLKNLKARKPKAYAAYVASLDKGLASIEKGPPGTAAKTADIINSLPPKKPTAASTVAATIAKGPPKPTTAA